MNPVEKFVEPSPQGRTVYEVSELADILRALVEDSLPSVWVQGEVSNFRNPSGHWYFTLKDAQAQLRCAMFKNKNFSIRPQPRDGDQVLLRGQVSFYTARGDLQLIVEHIEPAGEGALLRAFEQLKARLAAEGLFDDKLKRPVPRIPRAIGVVTSATAAALQDILTTLARRYPLAPVYLYPVPVQGAEAPAAIVRALAELPQRAAVDVLILARGGGSLEDLWCFNDEAVARAIRACAVPVVTGIGHEIDFTIADFAADLRAPTPTGAAERVSPDIGEWLQQLAVQRSALAQWMSDRLADQQEVLERHAGRLQWLHPGRRLNESVQRLDELELRLRQATDTSLKDMRLRAQNLAGRLQAQTPVHALVLLRQRVVHAQIILRARMANALHESRLRLDRGESLLRGLSPMAVLERGYAIARRANGEVLRDAAQVAVGEELELLLARGRIETKVTQAKP